MTNPNFMRMIEGYHKPAHNVKIKAGYVFFGLGLIGVAYLAIKSSTEKSKEIKQLKDFTSKNLESIKILSSKTEMLAYDLQQSESIITSLKNENKNLTVKIEKANNSAVPKNIEKL